MCVYLIEDQFVQPKYVYVGAHAWVRYGSHVGDVR